ncbi:MAG: thioredoxin domain-containing protein [Micropruina sp.]|nr:MAG: thioredoxin domain-containing protein [Micropruina sp.]
MGRRVGRDRRPAQRNRGSGRDHGESRKAKPGAPTLQIYLDYQCPWCKTLEDTHGKTIEELAAAGDINLVYSTKTFLDPGLRNDASYRSAVAAACADVAGVYAAYHDEVFANQPTTEGEGYSTDQLRTTFAQAAGINGDKLTAFQQCYDARTFGNFVKGVEEASAKAGVNTTPR